MARVMGGVLAIVLFVAVLVVGLVKKMPPNDVLVRALLAGGAGFILGWGIFGRIGSDILKDSTKITEEEKGEAKPESKGEAAPTAPPKA